MKDFGLLHFDGWQQSVGHIATAYRLYDLALLLHNTTTDDNLKKRASVAMDDAEMLIMLFARDFVKNALVLNEPQCECGQSRKCQSCKYD